MQDFDELSVPLKFRISSSPEGRTIHNVTYLPLAMIKERKRERKKERKKKKEKRKKEKNKERKGIFELDFMDYCLQGIFSIRGVFTNAVSHAEVTARPLVKVVTLSRSFQKSLIFLQPHELLDYQWWHPTTIQ
jgi:hypothetical protein